MTLPSGRPQATIEESEIAENNLGKDVSSFDNFGLAETDLDDYDT